ncbi:uncharacterized protein LOC117654342 [Thrips palmi]|uniref:Uncharacterized protein LOC117654342 n=1 Tax=Thrips palmi TaxID=161013 RepID=A0A6P9AES9_THRPL|nr:uncharacterized protein LOC117654342 [Thrips palmi]
MDFMGFTPSYQIGHSMENLSKLSAEDDPHSTRKLEPSADEKGKGSNQTIEESNLSFESQTHDSSGSSQKVTNTVSSPINSDAVSPKLEMEPSESDIMNNDSNQSMEKGSTSFESQTHDSSGSSQEVTNTVSSPINSDAVSPKLEMEPSESDIMNNDSNQSMEKGSTSFESQTHDSSGSSQEVTNTVSSPINSDAVSPKLEMEPSESDIMNNDSNQSMEKGSTSFESQTHDSSGSSQEEALIMILIPLLLVMILDQTWSDNPGNQHGIEDPDDPDTQMTQMILTTHMDKEMTQGLRLKG